MSMQSHHKARKDRARAQKAIQKDPFALQKMLAEGFHPDGRRRKSMKQVAAARDAKKSWLGTSLLKQLIGKGYLSPAGEGYSLTHKGKQLIANVPNSSAG